MKKTKKLLWGPSNRVDGQLPFKYSAPSCRSETSGPYKQQQRGDKPGDNRELEYSSAQSTKKKSKKAAEATMLTSKKKEVHTMEKCRGKAVQPRIPGNKFYTYTSPSSPLHGKLGPTTHPSPFFARPATSPSFSSWPKPFYSSTTEPQQWSPTWTSYPFPIAGQFTQPLFSSQPLSTWVTPKLSTTNWTSTHPTKIYKVQPENRKTKELSTTLKKSSRWITQRRIKRNAKKQQPRPIPTCSRNFIM
jgi:hypothetical protein